MKVLKKRRVSAEDFYFKQNRILFHHCMSMVDRSLPLDLIIVHEYLKKDGTLDDVGGLSYLQTLLDSTPTTAHAEHYIGILLDMSSKRALMDIYTEGMEEINGGMDGSKLVDKAQQAMSKLRWGGRANIKSSSASDAMLDQIALWKKAATTEAPIGVPTVFKSLQHYLPYYRYSMTAIPAEKGFGKSTLMGCEATYSSHIQKIPTLIVSMEQPVAELSGRILAKQADINALAMDARQMTDVDEKYMLEVVEDFKKVPLYIDRPKSRDIDDVLRMIEYYHEEYGVLSVWLDHFGKIKVGQDPVNDRIAISGALADSSLDRYALMVLAHISKEGLFNRGSGKRREPGMDDVKYCNAILDDARQVLVGANGVGEDDGRKFFKLEKNNGGACVDIELLADFRRFDISDIGKRYRDELDKGSPSK